MSASAGGGAVTLDGAIISTNTLGNIHVTGGLGQVSVNNQTGLPLVVQQVYTGSNSQTSTLASTVDITDTNKTTNPQTLYVYQPSTTNPVIEEYQGAAGATLGTGSSSNINGTSTTYQPESGLRWQWVEQATLGRKITYNSQSGSFGISPWNWTSGTTGNPWQYIDPSTNQVYIDPTTGVNVPIGQLTTNNQALENTAFTESITGSSSVGFIWDIEYHHDSNGQTHYGFATTDGPGDPNYSANTPPYDSSSGASDWYYNYVNSATLTLTSSVKADNGVQVDFSGLSTSDVNITSNAPVILAGQITNPNGNTTITAQGGVSETATGSVTSNNLTLTATGGSSTVAAVPAGAIQLWNNAQSGSFTLSVNVSGQTETTGPLPYNADAPTVLAALDSLPGISEANVNVTGTGTASDPWLISGVSGLIANDQGLVGGSATVSPVPAGAVQLWNTAGGGTFTSSVIVGGTTETTGPVDYNASASTLEQALNELAGVNVTVSGAGTAANPWIISGLTSALTTNDSSLTFQLTLQNAPTGAMELFNNATGGAFTISAVVGSKTEVTDTLDHNTTPAQLAAALDAITGVQATVTGSGTAADPWIISGTGFTRTLGE